MIKNQKQETVVLKEIADLRVLLADMDNVSTDQKLDFMHQMQYNILKGRIEDLNLDVDEYEHLTSENLNSLELTTKDLQKAIVSFRIASGLTQKDIAEKLEIQEQQIQRYEQNDYLTASFERIIQILQTLEVEVILKKQFSKKTKVIDLKKFLISKEHIKAIENSVQLVKERKQLVNW